ncbi:MAG TPA: iron uptake transporter permease EfeU [Pseudonocardiaceae bacterium]|nr:iron uptake transporter permease EfeU [Pseudonocardiaceae bacterium]
MLDVGEVSLPITEGDAVWADAVPNLLIGLREGLEGGLVVSILLAAVRRSAPATTRVPTRPVWLGVLAALMLSLSFGAVLTFSRAELASRAQEAFGGVLSVIAVVLVTAMIFWMRRTARDLSGELTNRVDTALLVGTGALAATAFLAVGREGLETALFVWTAVHASGETVAPLIGAAIGIAIAVALCWLLYRRAITLNLGMFFRRTAIVLIVIAGGVLAYGIGELQESGLVPGRAWLAFDITGGVGADSWWVSIIRGVTNLTPAMTWLQVVAYVLYIGIVLAVFLLTRPAPAGRSEPDRRRVPAWLANEWTPVGAAVLVPVVAAGAFALFAQRPAAGYASQQVTVTAQACGADFTALQAGNRTFTVVNRSGHAGEVYFVRASDGGVLGEAEGMGPGTQQVVSVAVATGSYTWKCQMSGLPAMTSAAVRTIGGANVRFPRNFAVPPLDPIELGTAIKQYQTYVTGQLDVLSGQVGTLRQAIDSGDVAAARSAWLPAQLTWERVGAAYDSFGDIAGAIDGGPDGLTGGVRDPDFTGLRRIEYGLWHGQPTATLAPYATGLSADVAELRRKIPTITAAPADMTIRVHEILEDAQRDHLSGNSDMGAGSGFAETMADVDGTRVVLTELAPLIEQRRAGLVARVRSDLDVLAQALAATRHDGVWDNEKTAPIAQRQRVDAAIGQELEDISPVPDLLEIGQS